MRILVTGGAGFIGSHVVEQLLARGDEVLVLDNLVRGKRGHVAAPARLEVVDICETQAAACVARFAPEGVVHLAAQMDVGASVRDPLQDARVNVLGSLNVLQAALSAGARVLVSASSGGAIYGAAADFPTCESQAWAPLSPYGASKACSELYLEMVARAGRLRGVSLRLSNVYGPRQSHRGEAGVVAIFAERMLRGASPLVYGDGAQSRDFVYVADVARAFVMALHHETLRGAYNVATGVETSLLQLAGEIARATRFDGALTFAPAKPGEVRRSCLSAAALRRDAGWQPQWALAQGLADTVAFLRKGIVHRDSAAVSRASTSLRLE